MLGAEDACLKCTLCVTACPVYVDDPNFPGPKALGPEWFRRHQAGHATTTDYVEDCTFCQLCEAACPVDVPVAHLIAEHKRLSDKPLRRRLRDYVLARPHWVARLPWATQVPPPVGRWVGLAEETQRPRVRSSPKTKLPGGAVGPTRGVVALFVDCYSRAFDHEVVDSAEALLRLWGYAVRRVPGVSRCCGAAAYAGGRPDTAQTIAREAEEQLDRDLTGVEALVTLNATCDGTLREEWPIYYGRKVRVPVVPFEEWALQHAPDGFWDRLTAFWATTTETVFTHSTCRAKAARGDGGLLALARRAGLAQAEPLDLACCGAAGSYAFKAEHAHTAQVMGSRAARQIGPRPGVIIVDSGTCALHLEQITGRSARHPAYWLYAWYREAGSTVLPESAPV